MTVQVSTELSPRKSRSAKSLTATDLVCLHAARTLPDSLVQRKLMLQALLKIVRAKHPLSRDLRAQLSALAVAEQFDAQLRQRLEGLPSENHKFQTP